MTDPAIQAFFQERKSAWLKKETKSSMDDAELQQLNQQADERFSYEHWLPDAAKRAGQISISTHPCTFSHPSARKNKNGSVTSVISTAQPNNDGFLRSGNVAAESDALGNAAALDVYKFLMLKLSDEQTLLQNIQQETDLARELLDIKGSCYSELRDGFLAMAEPSSNDVVTSSKIKQVYFPLTEEDDGDYHQLSILTNSGIVFELRKRLDAIRFGVDPESSDEKLKANYFSKEQLAEARKARREEQAYDAFDEIYNLTTIGYGGTKPQNISVLNNQNGGKAHLLLSVPPELKLRDIRFPTKNFFSQSIRFYEAKEAFQALHRIFVTHAENTDIPLRNLRSGRDNNLNQLIDLVIERMWQVRQVAAEQYYETTSMLDAHQKIWLLSSFSEQRLAETGWLDAVVQEIQQWIVAGYKKLNKQAVVLGDAETQFIAEFVAEYQEALR